MKKLLTLFALLGFIGLSFAEDRRVNLPNQWVYIEKKDNKIYYGADNQSDKDEGISWMREFRSVIKESDAKTFEMLNSFCGKDKNHAYYGYNSSFAPLLRININLFKPIRENCSYAIIDTGIIMDLPSFGVDFNNPKVGMPSIWTGKKYTYESFSLKEIRQLHRIGQDENYFYFADLKNRKYTQNQALKTKYNRVKEIFEKKVRGQFEEKDIKRALYSVKEKGKDKKSVFLTSMISALLDDYRPHEF